MKLYLDTANNDFVVALLDENFNLSRSIVLKNYHKKVELIPFYVEKILKQASLKINQISEFITNLGPGFFTGVRISLVYLRTIALVLNIKIRTISTMQIIAKQQNQKSEIIINANGGKYYCYENNDSNFDFHDILIKTGVFENYDHIDYQQFLLNFFNYQQLLKDYDDLMQIEPYYIKMPQIGVRK